MIEHGFHTHKPGVSFVSNSTVPTGKNCRSERFLRVPSRLFISSKGSLTCLGPTRRADTPSRRDGQSPSGEWPPPPPGQLIQVVEERENGRHRALRQSEYTPMSTRWQHQASGIKEGEPSSSLERPRSERSPQCDLHPSDQAGRSRPDL